VAVGVRQIDRVAGGSGAAGRVMNDAGRDRDGSDPVAVLVRRGERVESIHRVAYAVADAGGVLQHEGDIRRPVFPRSSVKPLQALALIESGAAQRFAVSERELALACASHGGEPMHTEIVAAWLARLGLDPSALECGAHPPSHESTARRLIAQGQSPSALHNNCSGKHAGMLTLALHLGAPTAGYIEPDHPVQQWISAVLAAMSGAGLAAPAIDGCGIPTYPLPLAALATAIARLGAPGPDPDDAPGRSAACAKIRAAMAGHPLLVAGTGRACSLIMAAVPEVLVKTGAEGVYVAALPAQKLGLALKVADGTARAAVVALMALLAKLGALDFSRSEALGELAAPVLRNHAGTVVGRIEAAPGWPSFDPPVAREPRHQA
jgi:L-asparaginase II